MEPRTQEVLTMTTTKMEAVHSSEDECVEKPKTAGTAPSVGTPSLREVDAEHCPGCAEHSGTQGNGDGGAKTSHDRLFARFRGALASAVRDLHAGLWVGVADANEWMPDDRLVLAGAVVAQVGVELRCAEKFAVRYFNAFVQQQPERNGWRAASDAEVENVCAALNIPPPAEGQLVEDSGSQGGGSKVDMARVLCGYLMADWVAAASVTGESD
jgi:hypothetical protein